MCEGTPAAIKIALMRRALKQVIRRPAPRQVSLSSNDPSINYFSASISFRGEDPFQILVNKVEIDQIGGLQWDGKQYSNERVIPNERLPSAKFEATHFYRGVAIRYSNTVEFLCYRALRIVVFIHFKAQLEQAIFNTTAKFRHDRIDTLQWLVNDYIQEHRTDEALLSQPRSQSIVSLFHRRYSERVFQHPKYQSEAKHFRLLIDSLVSSGDIKEGNDGYSILPKSLETLANYELQERRHKIGKWQNWLMVLLTFAIAAATGLSVYHSFVKQ